MLESDAALGAGLGAGAASQCRQRAQSLAQVVVMLTGAEDVVEVAVVANSVAN
jgi:hypothetical protein